MNTISRRQFLKLASGIGLRLAIAPLKLEAASTATLNQVWRQANQTPLLFDVNGSPEISRIRGRHHW